MRDLEDKIWRLSMVKVESVIQKTINTSQVAKYSQTMLTSWTPNNFS